MDKALHPLKVFKFCPKCGSSNITTIHEKAIQCTTCAFEFFFNSSGAVIALIFNEEDELLVTRRAFEPAKGELDLPGGFIDPDETAEEAVIREIKEELNLDVTEMQYLFTNHNRYPYAGVIVFTVDLVFMVTVKDLSPIKVADDVTEYSFIPKKDLSPDIFGLKSCNEVVENLGLNTQ